MHGNIFKSPGGYSEQISNTPKQNGRPFRERPLHLMYVVR